MQTVTGTRAMRHERSQMVDCALQAVAEAYGVRLYDLVLVRPGSLPRTTSGKIQRSVVRKNHQLKNVSSPANLGWNYVPKKKYN